MKNLIFFGELTVVAALRKTCKAQQENCANNEMGEREVQITKRTSLLPVTDIITKIKSS